MSLLVRELADDLFLIAGLIELDARISWVPVATRGTQSSNCYLIRSRDSALLIDTGLAVHREDILDALKQLVGDRTLSIATTRVNELDCIGNLGPFMESFRIQDFYSPTGGPQLPAECKPASVLRQRVTRGGDSIPVGPSRTLTVVEPAVRVLRTNWLHDARTGTMFTSDFLAYTWASEADAYRYVVARTADLNDVLPPAVVAERLLARFDWLGTANRAPAVARLNQIWDAFPIGRVAPGHGLVLEGTALKAVVHSTTLALQHMSNWLIGPSGSGREVGVDAKPR